jgi:polysaccharide export outer membrane protein
MKSILLVLMALLMAPMAMAQSYRIKAGDTLEINVLEDPTLNRSALVLPDGTISLPLAGTVRASGQTVAQLQESLASRLESNFAARPNVFVSVGALAEQEEPEPIRVYVVGEVASPGVHEIRRGANMLQAIAVAGGPTRFAATKRIQLRRMNRKTGQESIGTFNYKAVQNGSSLSGLRPLQNGDVIVIPERRLFE